MLAMAYLSFSFSIYAASLLSIYAVVFSFINMKRIEAYKKSVIILFDILNVVVTLVSIVVATLRLIYSKDASLYYIGSLLMIILFVAFMSLFILTILFSHKKKEIK